MSTPPLLSLCMIVRDGAPTLRRCLESVASLVDEMVLVDTGSRDDSEAIARSFGAQVLQVPWQDDFAAARNVGLERARGRWILVLDADEYLEPAGPEWLRSQLADPQYLGYYLRVHSPLDAQDSLDSWILRLFRSARDVRFRYPIHEQVLVDLQRWSEQSGLRFARLLDAHIEHDGYRPEEMERQGKVERNLRLFRKATAEHPDVAYLWYKYADFLRSVPGARREAQDAAQKAYALVAPLGDEEKASIPFLPELLAIRVAALLDDPRPAAAREFLADEPPERWHSPQLDYFAALAHERAGDVQTALECIERCCQGQEYSPYAVSRASIQALHGPTVRARLLLRRGQPQAALATLQALTSSHPKWPAGWLLLSDCLWALGRPAPALQALSQGLRSNPTSQGMALQAGLLLLQMRRPEVAVRFLERATGEPTAVLCLRFLEAQGEATQPAGGWPELPEAHERALEELLRVARGAGGAPLSPLGGTLAKVLVPMLPAVSPPR